MNKRPGHSGNRPDQGSRHMQGGADPVRVVLAIIGLVGALAVLSMNMGG